MADALTMWEELGRIEGTKVCFCACNHSLASSVKIARCTAVQCIVTIIQQYLRRHATCKSCQATALWLNTLGCLCCSMNSVSAGLQVVYVGDGNNITHSWIRLAAKFNFEFVIACPKGFEPDPATVGLANSSGAGKVSVSYEPMEVKCSLNIVSALVGD